MTRAFYSPPPLPSAIRSGMSASPFLSSPTRWSSRRRPARSPTSFSLTSRASASSPRSTSTAPRSCGPPSASGSRRRAVRSPPCWSAFLRRSRRATTRRGRATWRSSPAGAFPRRWPTSWPPPPPLRQRHRGGPGAGADRGHPGLAGGAHGLPRGSRGIFTTGGSLSNFAAIVAARDERLGEYFQDGSSTSPARRTPASPRPRAWPGSRGAPARAPGRRAAADGAGGAGGGHRGRPRRRPAPVPRRRQRRHDEHRRHRPAARDRRIAREHGLWVHADAAYGGFFRLAPGGEARLRGSRTTTR